MVEKIGRDAFLYLEPGKSPPENFAQCEPCRMMVPDEYLPGDVDRCIIHGSSVKVDEGFSCGFMCGWPTGKPNPEVIRNHAAELKRGVAGSVTPKESGLVDRPVRCENCYYHEAKPSGCGLYRKLQKAMPETFDFGGFAVHPKACCNANTAIPGAKKANDADDEKPGGVAGRLRLGPSRQPSVARKQRVVA